MTKKNRAVLGTHYSGFNQNYAGADNSAFQFNELHSREVITEGCTSNHLVFRRGENDGFWFRKSNKQPSIHQHTNRNVGQALGKDIAIGKCENTSSFSQSSEPASPTVARGYIPFSRCLNKTSNMESRQRKTRQKHDSISFFEIETDRAQSYKYRPGEEITGCIIIIVRRSFDLDFVQLVATGHGKVTRRVSSDGYARAFRETYLHKVESYMSKGGGCFSSVLLPGQYSIRFCVELPSDLPSSIHHSDNSHGLSFDVSYSLKARICGMSDMGTLWHTSAHSRHIRVLLEKQIHFLVERDFDVNAVPGAISPIIHTEKIILGRTHQIANTVTVTTDRGVFLAGDKIRVYLQVSLQASQSVKIPVGIGPCAEPINAEKNLSRTAIPFFNRPIRFPFFSAQKHPAPTSAHPSVSSKTSTVKVTAKYSAGLFFGVCLCCIHGRK